MTIAAAVCFAVALIAELRGIQLVVRQGRSTAAILQRWKDMNPDNRPEGTYGQMEGGLNGVVVELLAGQAEWRRPVELLIAGAVVGALGNYLSLSW